LKRVLTALILLPALLYAIWSRAPHYFTAFAAVASSLALAEFYELAEKVGCRPHRVLGHGAALALIACFALSKTSWIIGVLSALVAASLTMALVRPEGEALRSVATTLLGAVYVGMFAGFLVGVRAMPDMASVPRLGPKLLTLFFALVMMTDTGAYYVGRALGRRKLAPRISPKKTIEGAAGGFLSALAAGPLCKFTFFPELALKQAFILGAAIGAVSQLGDLAESLMKRGSGVKDSSNLLPGHGGMLDRMDSILFCAPLLYYYSRLLVD
jgi:phosphatidate cytidylyltransferase